MVISEIHFEMRSQIFLTFLGLDFVMIALLSDFENNQLS